MTDVIHKVLNDITVDEWAIIIGGDSHTRMSKGVALVRIQEQLLLHWLLVRLQCQFRVSKVTFKGDMKTYMDFRDVVHATQSQMLKQFGGGMYSKVESLRFI
jgi:aconitate hydratase 2/2-methylisocitrate dehydratase